MAPAQVTTAIFTGAGASGAIGYPLTKQLLPRIRKEIASGELFADTNGTDIDAEDRSELKRLLIRLMPAFERIEDKDLPLVTDVFSQVEHAIESGTALPAGDQPELRRLRDLLKQAITDVILGDYNTEFNPLIEEDRQQEATMEKFVDWLQRLGGDAGLITTNYDIGLEYELFNRVGHDALDDTLDLGFDWRDVLTNEVRTRPRHPSFRVYKLHGSLNQLTCPLCGHVYFNRYDAIADEAFRRELSDANSCICWGNARLSLNIVAPSMVRQMLDANLLSVWRSAMEWLRTARRWYIIGYSLPPEDIAVRSLLIRAYSMRRPNEPPPDIVVVQNSDDAKARYLTWFPDCEYVVGGVEKFLDSQGSLP